MHICFILLNDGPQLLASRPLTDVQIATRRRQAFLLNPDGMDSTTRCSDRSYPHLDFPLLNQLLWPGLRDAKPGNLTISIWAAPLWPIGCNESVFATHRWKGRNSWKPQWIWLASADPTDGPYNEGGALFCEEPLCR